jgi:acetyl esterase/lipase
VAIRILRDIPYAEAAISKGRATLTLAFDAYLPEGPGPFPAVVLAFGGAFHRGTKEDDCFPTAGKHGPNTAQAEYCRRFAAEGFACFSIRYRLAGDEPVPGATPVLGNHATTPLDRIAVVRQIMGLPPTTPEAMALVMEAAIDDFAAATRAIAARAAEYGVDPARMVLGGWSAGARCALYAAYGEGVPCAGIIALSSLVQAGDIPRHLGGPGPYPPVQFISAEEDIGYLRPEPMAAQVAELRAAGVEVRHAIVARQDHWYPAEAMTSDGVTVQGVMRAALRRFTGA